MRIVPRWALLSSGCAPVLMIAGWALAARLEGPSYDASAQTISVLAAHGAEGFWVMTAALLALGICHLLTAWGLRPAALPGRAALAAGGLSAFVVVLVPAPSSGGSLRHGSAVAVGFTLLAAWPVLATVRGGTAPWGLRPLPSILATALMCLGAAWFVYEVGQGGAPGIAERFVTSMQSLWPFVVVASCFRHAEDAAPAPSP
ncbi:membrane protein [Streptomyces sp. AS58]|uniref:DUF998 domain-containing protein n=1 Tax=Streptomyces sp. AS58 TaxID=1519489 RepID=UPI0006AFFD75|nr:DUF998 domain-containing protein [Streptomyces sp. AS58]KOV74684.1 membrane protein [Streptomyces sp. AS58]